MNFEQIDNKISNKGYRRKAGVRRLYNDDGTIEKVYDYEHRKRLDMFSVYVNDCGAVDCVEFTKVDFNRETRRFSQEVKNVEDFATLNKILG